MSIFHNCVKNVRVQTLSDCVKFSRGLMQKSLVSLSFELTTSKDQSYRVPLYLKIYRRRGGRAPPTLNPKSGKKKLFVYHF